MNYSTLIILGLSCAVLGPAQAKTSAPPAAAHKNEKAVKYTPQRPTANRIDHKPVNPDIDPPGGDLEAIAEQELKSPRHNLDELAKIAGTRHIDRLSKFSNNAFENSEGFASLKTYIQRHKINTTYAVEKRIQEFSVNGDDKHHFSVTFERNLTNKKWQIKHIDDTQQGRTRPLALASNDRVYAETVSHANDEGYFSEFPDIWQRLYPNAEKLKPLTEQIAVLDNVIFYVDAKDCHGKNPWMAFASITYAWNPPDTKQQDLKNGWLIMDFSSKEYDLGKEDPSPFVSPIPLPHIELPPDGVPRKNPHGSQTGAPANPEMAPNNGDSSDAPSPNLDGQSPAQGNHGK